MTKRSLGLIVLVLFVGTLLGSVLGELLGWILPAGVVKEFFLTSVSFDLAGLVGQESGVITLNLVALSIQFGFKFTLNFTSIVGLATAYYFLRYFR